MYLRKKMGWDTMEARRMYHLSLSVFKCLAGIAPSGMCNYFTYVSDSHNLKTRSSTMGKIRPIKPRLEYGKRTFHYRGAIDWNNLNSAIIHPMPLTPGIFKTKYQAM